MSANNSARVRMSRTTWAIAPIWARRSIAFFPIMRRSSGFTRSLLGLATLVCHRGGGPATTRTYHEPPAITPVRSDPSFPHRPKGCGRGTATAIASVAGEREAEGPSVASVASVAARSGPSRPSPRRGPGRARTLFELFKLFEHGKGYGKSTSVSHMDPFRAFRAFRAGVPGAGAHVPARPSVPGHWRG
jgi:hypothetical protein